MVNIQNLYLMQNNKIASITLFLLHTGFFAQAQLPNKLQDIICSARLVPTVGLGFTNLNAQDDLFDYEPKLSFQGGVYVPMQLSEYVQFIPGAQFETKGEISSYNIEGDGVGLFNPGARIAAVNNENTFETNSTRSYFSLPWRFGFTPVSSLPIQISTGLNNSFLLGQRSKENRFSDESTTSGTDGLRKFSLGILFGVSYQINELGIGFLYDHGLSNISDSDFLETSDRTVSITLSYNLNFNPIFKESYSKKGRRKMKMYN